MAIKKLIIYDDKLLRRKSRPVHDVDRRVRGIFTDMADTLYSKKNGGGLAACQIGILYRLVIADTGKGLLMLANPRIEKIEGEQLGVEGCLSIPGILGQVKRPRRIIVKALNGYGRPVTVAADGELARCLCHEIDHLDGILFIDKAVEYIGNKK